MKTCFTTLLLALCPFITRAADIITLIGTNSYTVGANDVAEIISVSETSAGGGPRFLVNGVNYYSTFSSGTGGIVSNLPFIIAGPDKTIAGFGTVGIVTIRVRPKTDLLSPGTQPAQISNAVVIPADAAGPVNILLESSTDLVTWTAASPGTYGSSTVRRFFRVRGAAQ